MFDDSSLRIVVLGYLVRGPIGGMAWSDLHYLLGLRMLGHDVYFVEDSDDYASCYDPTSDSMTVDSSYGLRFASEVLGANGFGDRWAYFDAHRSEWRGPAASAVLGVCASADLLLDLGGVNPLRPWLARIPARALIDKDPVFTQVRHLTDPAARERAGGHTHFFSFGENIGRASSTPQDGFPWQPTRHPIALSEWPPCPPARMGAYTTVMQWDSYAAAVVDGVRYGMKSESFGPFLELPAHAPERFELAIGSTNAPRGQLRSAGWTIRAPTLEAWKPLDYQQYIQASKGEFTVAKHGYVAARCGWFSERSAAYLASGRPVVTQDTGFGTWLTAGRGVIAFTSLAEAITALRTVEADYELHCREARVVAEEYFDSAVVLRSLVDRAMAPPVEPGSPRVMSPHGDRRAT